MNTDDQALVLAAQKDPQQFDVLYEKYFQSIYNYFWYRVGHDVDVAEDLTQDTFVAAFQNLSKFTVQKASYQAYLLKIAHNLLVNYYRKSKVVPLETALKIPVEILSDIERDDQLARLWQAVQKLAPAERDVLYLKYSRGYKVAEIASITSKTNNAVKLTLSRARKKLAAQPPVRLVANFGAVERQPSEPRYRKQK